LLDARLGAVLEVLVTATVGFARAPRRLARVPAGHARASVRKVCAQGGQVSEPSENVSEHAGNAGVRTRQASALDRRERENTEIDRLHVDSKNWSTQNHPSTPLVL
jgi:hypothetical protein